MRVVMISTLLALPLVAAPAEAQRDPGAYASEQCWRAVVREARGRLAAQGIYQAGSPYLSQQSNAETRVTGSGTADGRRFNYGCTYNIRSGQTYSVSVSGGAPAYRPPMATQQPGWRPPSNYRPGYGHDWSVGGVPGWAIGKFEGRNPRTRDEVSLRIRPDASVTAKIDGRKFEGKIKRGQLRIGLYHFNLIPTRDGLMTQEVGNPRNVVYYRRR